MSKCRLAAYIRSTHHSVGDGERLRLDLLIRRRQGVESPAKLVDLPRLRSARELTADAVRIHIASEQQAGLKDWSVAHNFD